MRITVASNKDYKVILIQVPMLTIGLMLESLSASFRWALSILFSNVVLYLEMVGFQQVMLLHMLQDLVQVGLLQKT